MNKLDLNSVEDLLRGNSWFATGGGFPSEKARKIFREILNKKSIILKSLDEFTDSDILCVASGVGSIKKTEIDITKHAKKAVRILETTTKVKIKGIVSGETGLECIAATTASQLNLPIVDADMKGGRAAPEPSINMFNLKNIPVTPAVAINTDGDVSILSETSTPQKLETFLRNFANMAAGTFVAWSPKPAKEFKRYLISGTISKSIKLGNLLKKKLTFQSIEKHLHGKILCHGVVKKILDEKNKGFLVRKVIIENNKKTFCLWIKNENLALTIGGKAIITCPDLIILIDPKTNLGMYNNTINIGQSVFVLALAHDKKWHTKRGYEIFGPNHFGFPFELATF